MSQLEQAVEAVREVFNFEYFGAVESKIDTALRPFFERQQQSVEVDLDLDQRIVELCEALDLLLPPGVYAKEAVDDCVSKHVKALAAELPAPRVSEETIEEVLDLLVETRLHSTVGPVLRKILNRQPKPQEPQAWPAGEPYPGALVSVKKWLPRGDGDRIQVRWGRGYESAGVWDDGAFHLMGPRGDYDDLEALYATHWCRLKESHSA